jgi:hypothetical protein
MQDYCITKLIGLENVIVSNIVETDTHLEIFIETKPCHQSCPQCGKGQDLFMIIACRRFEMSNFAKCIRISF